MDTLSILTQIKFVALVSFSTVGLAVVVAVFAKAYGNFPHRPDESKVFRRYSLPRSRLLCFQFFERRKPEPKHVRHLRR